jgi:hypothetical protein
LALCEGEVHVLLGDGQGGFPTVVSTTAGGSNAEGELGDLNGDGWPDLVTNPGEYVFLGDGRGGFTSAGWLHFTTGWLYLGLELADFDGDGHLDVLSGDYGQMKLFFGDGQGGFPTSVLSEGGSDLVSGDLDHGGDPDPLCQRA